jgi:hypothetical protein
LKEAGVKLLLHSFVVDAEIDAGDRLNSVVISTKRGFHRIIAKRFIDATGDADLCRWADVAFERAGDIEPAQTLTTTFRMSNVDFDKFTRGGGKKMLDEKMREAVEKGTHPLPRKSGSVHPMVYPNSIATVAVRVADIDGTDFEQLTQAEQIGREQAYIYEKFLRECVAGYESAVITGLSTQIGVRESRRVYGEYRLTKEDCLTAAKFDDAVFLCGSPVEDHRQNSLGEEETVWEYVPDGAVYEVPYRTLVPRGRDELWVAGRCFSATHDAHASCRSMAQTMSMGQAAGLAAVISLEDDCSARAVEIRRLQERLVRLGAILQFPEKIALTGADDWKLNF